MTYEILHYTNMKKHKELGLYQKGDLAFWTLLCALLTDK